MSSQTPDDCESNQRSVTNFGQYAEGNIYNYSSEVLEYSRNPSEAKLLNFVTTEIVGRLEQSLHKRIYLELNKTFDLNQVSPPWGVEIKVPGKPVERCSENTHIIEIFDKPEISGRLLILGTPGSGKTTMLLQLAQILVQRGVNSHDFPVPVLLNLSTWNQKFSDIPTWIVSDLKLKYGVREDVSKKWIREERILPLLDGLDELMSERQEDCVIAINDFLTHWSNTPLVICSRFNEYQVYETKLTLNGSAILQPLNDKQIIQYLSLAERQWLWDLFQEDDSLIGDEGLARSPLLLTVLIISSKDLRPELWKGEQDPEKLKRIWIEAFISICLKRTNLIPKIQLGRKGVNSFFIGKEDQILTWLTWLAWSLNFEQKTEFFIEELQPRLLVNRKQLVVYGFIGGLIGGSVGSIVGFIFLGIVFNIRFGAIFGFFAAMIAGLFYALKGKDEILPSNSIVISVHSFRQKRIVHTFWDGIRFGTLYSSIFGIIYFVTKRELGNGIILSILYCLSYGLIYTISKTVTYAEVDIRRQDNQGIRRSISNSLTLCFASIPVGLVMAFAIRHLNIVDITILDALILGCGCGYFGLDSGGFSATCKHLALRASLFLFGYSPINYSTFLRYCTQQGLLQRVGGGYRFVHSIIRDYLASSYRH